MTDLICLYCGKPFAQRTKSQKYCSLECGQHNKRHGLTDTPENRCWRNIRRRCNSVHRPSYKYYGGRGIKLCERWDDFNNFLADMGPRPGPEYSVERIDNDGHYEPGNCRWATQSEQNRNKSDVYTAEEDAIIRDAAERGLNFTQMTELLERSKSSISMRAYRLRVPSGQPVRKIMP